MIINILHIFYYRGKWILESDILNDSCNGRVKNYYLLLRNKNIALTHFITRLQSDCGIHAKYLISNVLKNETMEIRQSGSARDTIRKKESGKQVHKHSAAGSGTESVRIKRKDGYFCLKTILPLVRS